MSKKRTGLVSLNLLFDGKNVQFFGLTEIFNLKQPKLMLCKYIIIRSVNMCKMSYL